MLIRPPHGKKVLWQEMLRHELLDALQAALAAERFERPEQRVSLAYMRWWLTQEPADAPPVIVRVAGGSGNRVSDNHVVASDVDPGSQDSAFEAQVEALLSTAEARPLPVVTVRVDPASSGNTILDSGTEDEVDAEPAANAVRFTPAVRASHITAPGQKMVRT